MSQPYVGEIRAVGFSFAPVGWFLCQGQLVSIANYDVLFNLLGTTYGGDGVTSFGLPNLAGRTAVHWGNQSAYGTTVIGQSGGSESVSLSTIQYPAHSHSVTVNGALGSLPSPIGNYLSGSNEGQFAASGTSASGPILQAVGNSLPHENRQPFLCINYVIAWSGVYPSQS